VSRFPPFRRAAFLVRAPAFRFDRCRPRGPGRRSHELRFARRVDHVLYVLYDQHLKHQIRKCLAFPTVRRRLPAFLGNPTGFDDRHDSTRSTRQRRTRPNCLFIYIYNKSGRFNVLIV